MSDEAKSRVRQRMREAFRERGLVRSSHPFERVVEADLYYLSDALVPLLADAWDEAVQVGVEHEARSTAWIEGRIGGSEPPWPANPYRDA